MIHSTTQWIGLVFFLAVLALLVWSWLDENRHDAGAFWDGFDDDLTYDDD